MKPSERLELLDKALQRKTYPSWSKLSKKYSSNNLSKRTFEQDIRLLKDRLNESYPNIEVDKHLKFNKIKNGYYYAEDVAGIDFISKVDLNNLIELSRELYNHRNLMLGNTARELLQRLYQVHKAYDSAGAEKLANWDLVSFEQNGLKRGQDHFDKLILAIKELRTIQFSYRKYGSDNIGVRTDMLPVLIKEWDNAWFLLVLKLDDQNKSKKITLKADDLRMFALDRMSNIILQDYVASSFITNATTFDPSQYFEHVYGVRNNNLSDDHAEKKVHHIDIEIMDEWHYGYFLNNPIHPTKEILVQDEDSNYLKLRLTCQLNPELETLILQFSPAVKVLAPAELRQRIRERLTETLEHYS